MPSRVMLIKVERVPLRITKHLTGFREQDSTRGQLIDRRRSRVGWADLKERIRPEPHFMIQRMVDEIACSLVGNRDK